MRYCHKKYTIPEPLLQVNKRAVAEDENRKIWAVRGGKKNLRKILAKPEFICYNVLVVSMDMRQTEYGAVSKWS